MTSAPRPVWGDLATTAFVESSHLFKSLDPDARRDLLQLAKVLEFEAGEVVPAAAETGESFYLVREGTAAVLVPGAQGLVEIARLERGAFFGEGRIVGSVRPASLSAVTHVTILAFPALVIGAMAERFPKVRKLLEAVQTARDKEAAARLAS